MSQLVGQRRHIVDLAIVVDQHPGGQLREHAIAVRAAHLARAHFGIQVLLVDDAHGVIGQRRRESAVGVVHHPHGLIEGVGLLGLGERRVDIVAAQPVHAQRVGLEAEIALEEIDVLTNYLEQGLDHLVGHIVIQVLHTDRAGELAQLHIFRAPVAHARRVDLRQHVRVLLVDAVELLIGSCPQFRVRAEHIGHELTARQLFLLAVYGEMVGETRRDHIIERQHCAHTVDVLDVDDALYRLAERVRLEAPQALQEVAKVAAVLHQLRRRFIVQ